MPNPSYHRFAITVPQRMAAQIDQVCKHEGRNRSEFFREAVRCYMNVKQGGAAPLLVLPTTDEENRGDALRLFDEWHSSADAVYDVLTVTAQK
jgi:Arc/MetJ-type ribon-helix-helix transcriptional regulator